MRQGHDAERKAHEMTDRLIESKQEKNSKRKFYNPKKLARNIWGYDKNRRKYLENARKDIQVSGSLHGADGEWTDEQRTAFKDAEINRLIHGVDEAVDTHAGENREFFEDDHEVATGTKELMSEFARSTEMTDDQFNEKMDEIRAKMGDGTDEMHVSNYLEVARAIRGRIEQGEAMDDVLEGFKVVRAESRSDVRSEIHKTKIDNLYDKFEQSRFGRVVPASVLAVGVGVGLFVAERGVKSTALKVGTLGASAGLIGAISAAKTHAQNNRLRSVALAEKARGKEYGDGNKKVEQISAYDYEKISSDSLVGGLEGLNEQFDAGEIDGNLASEALNRLADLQALKSVSAARGIELIDVGTDADPSKRSKDRLAMATESAKLKSHITEMIQGGDAHTLEALGLDPATDISALDSEQVHELVNHAIGLRSEAFANTYSEEITSKDRAWAKYNAKDAAVQGAKSAALALTAGTVMQEVVASFSANQSGVVEKLWGADNKAGAHNTLLNSFSGTHYSTEHIDALSDDQVNKLRSEGATVTKLNDTMNSKTIGAKESVRDFLNNSQNKGDVRHFKTVNLYTNGTEHSDLNELGGMMGKNPDGSIRVWADMAKHGSFNTDGSSIDMNSKEGGTKVFTIMTKEPDGSYLSRNYAFGQKVEPPLSNLFEQNADGSFSVKGGENVTVAWGRMNGDTLDVAASLRGSGEPMMLDTSKVEASVKSGGYDVTRATGGQTDGTAPVWFKGNAHIGTAQRPKPAPTSGAVEPTPPEAPPVPGKEVDTIEPTTPGAPSRDTDQIPAQREIESAPKEQKELERPRSESKEFELREDIAPEQQTQQVELESRERQVAREAGWNLDGIRIGHDQGVAAETWSDAARIIEAARAEYPDVSDPLEQLRAAVRITEESGRYNNPETRGLLEGLLAMNENDRARAASASERPSASQAANEARSTGPASESTNDAEPQQPTTSAAQPQSAPRSANQEEGQKQATSQELTPEGEARLEELNNRIEGIMSVSGKEAQQAGVTDEALNNVRSMLSRAIMERGPQVSNKELRRYVQIFTHTDSEAHADRESDKDTFVAASWLLKRME